MYRKFGQPNCPYLSVFATSDANWESKINHALKVLDLRRSFEERNVDYGASLTEICIVFMCRDPELNLKQRIRYMKATRDFSMDIMLHLPEVIRMTHPERRQLIADALLRQVPERLRRYDFPDFDYARFEVDWTNDIRSQLLADDSNRYDHLCLERATI